MSIDDRSQEKFGFDEDAARPIPTDGPHSFTVLRALPSRERHPFLTKRYTKDRQWRSYDKAYLFSATSIDIRSLDDLHRQLTQITNEPRCCMVPGAITDGADRRRMRRLSHDHKDKRTGKIDKATLRDVPRHLLAMDVDEIPRSEGIDPKELEAVAAHVRSRLPRAFHDASCIAMATSGHCIKLDLRVRMFFMLDRALTIAEMKTWLSRENAPVDRSIYTPGGVIYTATAIFETPSDDPLPDGRIVRLDGESHVTPPSADEFIEMTTKKKSSSRKFDHANESPNEVLRRVTEALGFIPSDDYDVWVKVGMALHWAGAVGVFGESGDDIARELFDEWSQASEEKYDPAEVDTKWDSFDAGRGGSHGPLTLDYIFKLARDNGWKPSTGNSSRGKKIDLVSFKNIEAKPIDWLWNGWLARGKIEILAGTKADGKSTIAFSLAAIVSRGGNFPDGAEARKGKVIIWSGEDALDDTIKPRLMAMNADMDNIFAVSTVVDKEGKRAFDPSTDLNDLEAAIAEIGGVDLVIIDPLVSAIVKGKNSHNNAETRQGMQHVVDFAEKHQCAVIGIHHLTKGTEGQEPIARVTGSLAIGAIARIVLMTVKKKSDDEGPPRLLMRAYSNIGAGGGAFGYDIERIILHEPAIETTQIKWLDRVAGEARDLMAEAEEFAKGGESRSKLTRVCVFLRMILEPGPMSQTTIMERAKGEGHSETTLRRAKKEMSVLSRKESEGWVWALPDDTPI